VFDDRVDVAEIMLQIKKEAIQKEHVEEIYPSVDFSSDQTVQDTIRDIAQLTKTIRETRRELHDSRNVGGIVPAYAKFPPPFRQLFRFFSRILRKGIQFVIQDQVNVNSQIDTILSAVEKKEELMMRLILEMNREKKEKEESVTDSQKTEEQDENTD